MATHQQQWSLKIKLDFKKLLGIKLHRTENSTLMYDDTYFTEAAMELDLHSQYQRVMSLPHNKRYLPNTQYRASKKLLSLYQSLVGSLLWGSNNWRPDGAYIVGHLARFLANPSFEHLDAAIDVLYYFISTKEYGLLYTKSNFELQFPLRLECITYTDSDWDKEFDHVSVSGHVMQICTPAERNLIECTPSGDVPPLPLHNVLSWFSRKQKGHVALSTEDAESTASVSSTTQMMWVRGLFDEFSFTSQTSPERPWLLLCDNSATVANLHSGKISNGNQHNARHFAYTRNEVKQCNIFPWKIDTKLNYADMMTKVLPPKEHFRHIHNIMSAYIPTAGQIAKPLHTKKHRADKQESSL